MPIRLLFFKPVRSKFQITLIERGEIYAHITYKLVRGIDSLRVSVNGESEQDLREILHSWYPSEDAAQTAIAIDSGAEKAERMVLEGLIDNYSGYAILSHTWLRGDSREVTYGDWIRSEFDPHSQEPGCRKLVNFCRTAWKDYRVAFGWMDTVCINKESSAELDESIRSMYKWYQGAHVCITYLAETVAHSDIPKDTWFTRGWTLQEFLAPSHLKFYNTDWDKLVESLESDKNNSIITKKIEEATTITADELKQHMFNIPISRRMQIAAKRQVTREEDSAYSLMGIFDVSIATAYGEGAERAFSRLLQAVLNSTSKGIADIFNWAGPNHSRLSALLPSSPQHYLDRASILGQRHIKAKPIEPIMLTHLGLRIAILLMPAILTLHSRQSPLRDYHGIAYISTLHERDPPLHRRDVSGSYSVLDSNTSINATPYNWIHATDNNSWINATRMTLGVLNIEDTGNERIRVPRHCLAVALLSSELVNREKVATKAPVTFHLNNIRDPETSSNDYYLIERRELESHGMELHTLIL
jgi:hypothetical protein